MGRNPSCQRLGALTLTGITPATAVKEIYQEPLHEGQSPFAIAVGNTFERVLFAQGAARLLDLYRSVGRLPISQARIVLIDDLVPLAGMASMSRRRALTQRFLARFHATAPSLGEVARSGRFSGNLYDLRTLRRSSLVADPPNGRIRAGPK